MASRESGSVEAGRSVLNGPPPAGTGSPVERKGRELAVLLGTWLVMTLAILAGAAFAASDWSDILARGNGFLQSLVGLSSVVLLAVMALAYILIRRKEEEGRAFAIRTGFEYTARPDRRWSEGILAGSVVGGSWSVSGSSLLRGSRNSFYFQAIDNLISQGEDSFYQTVVCVPLPLPTPVTFAIISDGWPKLFKQADKNKVEPQPAGLGRDHVLLVDKGQAAVVIPPAFLAVVAARKKLCVEVLEDRLLVYRFNGQLTGDDYLEWIDLALGLVGTLG